MTDKKPDFEIIIVSYNSAFWLHKALSSLEKHYLSQTKKKVQVSVVDNASQDDTATLLKRDFPWVKTIFLPENLGFAAANNVALKQSRAKYVMLMNSDLELNQNSRLDVLLSYLDKNPQVGVITPRVEHSSGALDLACHRGEPTLRASLMYFSHLEQLLPQHKFFAGYHQLYKDLNSIHSIDACSGAAMIVRQKAIQAVGLLDERFFMYAEDLDWCKRMRDSGYLVVYHPGVKVIHHKYKSGIKTTSQALAKRTKYHFYDTMLQYFDKHYAYRYPAVVRSLVRFGIVLKKGAL